MRSVPKGFTAVQSTIVSFNVKLDVLRSLRMSFRTSISFYTVSGISGIPIYCSTCKTRCQRPCTIILSEQQVASYSLCFVHLTPTVWMFLKRLDPLKVLPMLLGLQ